MDIEGVLEDDRPTFALAKPIQATSSDIIDYIALGQGL